MTPPAQQHHIIWELVRNVKFLVLNQKFWSLKTTVPHISFPSWSLFLYKLCRQSLLWIFFQITRGLVLLFFKYFLEELCIICTILHKSYCTYHNILRSFHIFVCISSSFFFITVYIVLNINISQFINLFFHCCTPEQLFPILNKAVIFLYKSFGQVSYLIPIE